MTLVQKCNQVILSTMKQVPLNPTQIKDSVSRAISAKVDDQVVSSFATLVRKMKAYPSFDEGEFLATFAGNKLFYVEQEMDNAGHTSAICWQCSLCEIGKNLPKDSLRRWQIKSFRVL